MDKSMSHFMSKFSVRHQFAVHVLYNDCSFSTTTKQLNTPSCCVNTPNLVHSFLSAVACTYFDPPAYGIRACNKKTLNSNDVIYEMVCVIQCKDGYAFADQAAPNTYMCQSDGTWNKLLYGQVLVPVYPKSQRPWPDCARK